MSLILSGSEGLSDVDGTAATPAIRGTDTNTGIFFPAADTIAFAEGGVESMRLDSSGNLGVGTGSPKTRLQSTASANLNAPSLGSATNAPFYLTNTDTAYGLLVGTSAADGRVWLQAQRTDGTATAYNITLNEAGGNVGIGTSSPSNFGGVNLQVQNSNIGSILWSNGTFTGQLLASASAEVTVGSRSNHPLRFGTNDTERMRIDTSGNVGIGTSSPTARLQIGNNVGSAGAANQIRLYESGSSIFGFGVSAGQFDYRGASHVFYSDTGTERMRIDSSGRFLVGTTSSLDNNSLGQFLSTTHALQAQCNATDGGWYAFKCVRIGSTGKFVGFVYGNQSTEVGSISTGGTTTAYNTSSDYRLKHDIAPMTGALAKVAALKPVTYKWNVDGSDGEGFIAHELAEVCPDAVTGEKDAVDEDGNPKYQGIDTSFLVATLTAAIQELKAELDAVKTELAALKGTA